MKILIFILFPLVVCGQSEFERIDLTVGFYHILADQSYVHLPNHSVIRAKMSYNSRNVKGLEWKTKLYEYYIGYVDNELCFVQENRRTKNLVSCWVITDYKITYYK